MPSLKTFLRRLSTGSDSSNSSEESFHCQGIPADFYSEIYDSPEDRARKANASRRRLRAQAIYDGYAHVQQNVLPEPANYYVAPAPVLPPCSAPARTTQFGSLANEGSAQRGGSVRRGSSRQRVRFAATLASDITSQPQAGPSRLGMENSKSLPRARTLSETCGGKSLDSSSSVHSLRARLGLPPVPNLKRPAPDAPLPSLPPPSPSDAS